MKKELVLNMRLLIFYYFNGALLGVFYSPYSLDARMEQELSQG
jgi:hypothetical protein